VFLIIFKQIFRTYITVDAYMPQHTTTTSINTICNIYLTNLLCMPTVNWVGSPKCPLPPKKKLQMGMASFSGQMLFIMPNQHCVKSLTEQIHLP